MLSLEQCKKILKTDCSDESVIEIKDTLYQMVQILVENYLTCRDNRDGGRNLPDNKNPRPL